MKRRDFFAVGGAAALGLALDGCASRPVSLGGPQRRAVGLVPVDVSWDRIIRTTVGLRPYRPSGFVVRADRLDEKTVIHNYGHGGAGMSLSWGTAALASDLAMAHTDRRAAVIGCGIVGLTSARQLQRRGFDVTIYAKALPPDTTSNMSWAGFTPTSGLVSPNGRTPEWDDQFRRAVEIAYRQHQLLVGREYGVDWLHEYSPTNSAGAAGSAGRGSANTIPIVVGAGRGSATTTSPIVAGAGRGGEGGGGLLPSSVELGRVTLGPGEHPFATRYARVFPTMRFEPSVYLEALMRDVLAFGGRIVVRAFDTPRDLMTLTESLIVNCTGLGARELFGDTELMPVKGQLVVLVPQPEVIYSTGSMLPRRDGIVLGHVMQRGVETLEVDEEEQRRVMEQHLRFFAEMRGPAAGVVSAAPGVGTISGAPPVESFFGRES
jgi:glycine/D-amino acid oxidase-like deaminating enzyme